MFVCVWLVLRMVGYSIQTHKKAAKVIMNLRVNFTEWI